jgi:ankyrin repeat protein
MKQIKLVLLVSFILSFSQAMAQTEPAEITAVKNNDSVALVMLLNKVDINNCYDGYSLLSQAIRHNAKKCFDLLIQKNADVNLVCNGYVPPLMHAAKYGHLDMVKILIAKGADPKYEYNGDVEALKGMTPLKYAEAFKRNDIVEYLKSLQ